MLEEDLHLFVNNDFSSIAKVVDSGLLISGLYDEEYAPMLEGATEGRIISFCCLSEEITNIRHGDELEINERQFEIVGIQPLSDGKLTDLILKEI